MRLVYLSFLLSLAFAQGCLSEGAGAGAQPGSTRAGERHEALRVEPPQVPGLKLLDQRDDGRMLWLQQDDSPDAPAGDAMGASRLWFKLPDAPAQALELIALDARLHPTDPSIIAWTSAQGELKEGSYAEPSKAQTVAKASSFAGLSYAEDGRLVFCAGRAPRFDVFVRERTGQLVQWTRQPDVRWMPFFGPQGQTVYVSQGRGIARYPAPKAQATMWLERARQPSLAPSPRFVGGVLVGYDSRGRFTLNAQGQEVER